MTIGCAYPAQNSPKHCIKNSADSGIDWLCRVCKSTKSDLKSINTTLLEMKKSNETRLSGVEDRLSHLESNVKVTVREEVELAKNNITESVKKDIAETVEKIVESRKKLKTETIVLLI